METDKFNSLGEKRLGFYYREQYFLLPDEFSSVDEFKNSIDAVSQKVRLKLLTEDNRIPSMIQKGVCIAPYFYSEYGFMEATAEIENASEIYPVDIILFTQKEYNEALRNVILTHCPGCRRYKPITNRVQSLNGHFEEISLNGVCFYRQIAKPAPRIFRDGLFGLGGLWHHFDPYTLPTDSLLEEINDILHIKYESAKKNDDQRIVHISFKSDFFTQIVSEVLKTYIEKTLTFTNLRLQFDSFAPLKKEDFMLQTSKAALKNTQGKCKRYGVTLAVLSFDPTRSSEVNRSIADLFEHYYAVRLFDENGSIYLMLLDENNFLKQLHFRSPLLQSANTAIDIYNQYEVCRYSVSFEMKRID